MHAVQLPSLGRDPSLTNFRLLPPTPRVLDGEVGALEGDSARRARGETLTHKTKHILLEKEKYRNVKGKLRGFPFPLRQCKQ
ncbi:Hypothetical predicted protein [Podarcis lilfordi]|uniref:Uncharacterized protein n=1 Tax=Podarcis lilfordi TaxID=74358 RepID=A0AA35NYU7_9SAUR|nr:Hypothetical predicted protein [Podarcis lilfordi]